MKNITFLSFTSLFLLTIQLAQAGDAPCESTGDGNWEDTSTWTNCGGGIPRQDRGALIKSNHTVTINQSTGFNSSVTLEASSTLATGVNAGEITITAGENGFLMSQGEILLQSDLILNNGDSFDPSIIGVVNGTHNLTITSNGNIELLGDIGQVSPLNSLTTDADGTTVISSNNISLLTATFDDPVVISDSLVLNAVQGDIQFNSTLDGLSGTSNQIIMNASNGEVFLGGNVGITEQFLDFTINAVALKIFASTINNQRITQLNVDTIYLNSPDNSTTITGSSVANDSTAFTIGNPSSVLLIDPSTTTHDLELIAGFDMEIRATLGSDISVISNLNLNATELIYWSGNEINAGDFTVNATLQLDADLNLNADSTDFQDMNINANQLTLTKGDTFLNENVVGNGIIEVLTMADLNIENQINYSGQLLVSGEVIFGNMILSDNPIPLVTTLELAGGRIDAIRLLNADWSLSANQTVMGNGFIQGNLILTGGASINPDEGSIIINTMEMQPGSNYILDQDTAGFGLIQVTGAVMLSDANLVVNVIGHDANEITLIDTPAPSPVAGTFLNLPEGAVAGSDFSISYVGGNGNDVVLSPTCTNAITVSNGNDSGSGSMRQAIEDACVLTETVIDFDDDYSITLDSSIAVNTWVNLLGNGQTISGANAVGLFEVMSGAQLILNKLNLINSGSSAINNSGELTVSEIYFANNSSGITSLGGGAIRNFNQMAVLQSSFYQNNSQRGGAIFNDGTGSGTIENSTFFQNGNLEISEGGAIHNRGTLVINNSSIVDSGDGSNVVANSIFNWNALANLTLNNTLVASPNTDTECVNTADAVVSGNNFLVDDGSCSAPLEGDPLVADWSDNGGFAQSIGLQANSPMINAGDNSTCADIDQISTARPQGSTCDVGAVELVDDVAPTVTALFENNQILTLCDSRNTEVNVLQVSFSEPVLNATDVSNYWLRFAGEDNSFDDTIASGGIGDDQFWTPDSVVSDGGDIPIITVTFAEAIPDGLVRLDVIDNITDFIGNSLNNGQGEYNHQFRIERGNLFKNAHFDNCPNVSIDDPWTTSPFPELNSADADDSFNSNSISKNITDLSGLDLGQCQNISGTLPLGVAAAFRFSPFDLRLSQSGIQSFDVYMFCELYDQADCMGNIIDVRNGEFQEYTVPDQWHRYQTVLTTPDSGTQSVFCQASSVANDFGTNTVLFDQLKLTENDLIFENGFDSDLTN